MDMTLTETRDLVVTNRLGLHARAAAKLVQTVEAYRADIRLVKNGEKADARSVLSLISLGCAEGARVTVEAEGADALNAVLAVKNLFEERFGEE
ncbi:MAG: HPr family phosphocarrier protein [Candidatus Adiutrix sp.]|jgi:phosphocarrier protein|nr:HPr family phosphocarrier protein [Candidatus Adiutrix sp.]